MGRPTGFLDYDRELPRRRPVPVRLRDWREVYEPFPAESARRQGARCMDCGIPFCHEGCPLGNLIPEWNDLVYHDDWSDAIERLHATNNFPELTGRLCPAPCEGACVLGINAEPVTIKQIEVEISERAFSEGWVRPQVPRERWRTRVAVVGSGPAGLACAQQLARAGHGVVVFERAERAGGLLRYGIPEFKMEKAVLDRRLDQLAAEGIQIRCGTSVGLTEVSSADVLEGDRDMIEPGQERGLGSANAPQVEIVPARRLLERFDALVLAGGATRPRELDVPGRSLSGVHLAMEYLKAANLVCEGALAKSPVSATGKHVVIIGGGDTGADCLGTVHRQGAASVQQFEIMPAPPDGRSPDNPWPTWPLILRSSAAHEEGGARRYCVTTTAFVDDGSGNVCALAGHQVELERVDGRPSFTPVPGSDFEIPCDVALLALGFAGAERNGIVAELGVELTPRGTVTADEQWATNVPGVFVCGDMTRGQSLIVWAIAEGRSAAAAVDRYLTGGSELPAPLRPGQLALT